ncbi:MAG: carbon-nitrogen hydrolase family protein [Mariniphaga sp.]
MKQQNNNLSRRNFLRNAAITTGIAASGPLAAAASAPDPGNNRKKLPREVWITSVSQEGLTATSPEAMINQLYKLLESKTIYQPDIVCLPETFTTANISTTVTSEQKKQASAYALEKFSQFAKQHGCYVICPVITQENGKSYNSGVLFDRSGKQVGEYHKIHLTEGEISRGLTPGSLDPPVFKTDFGTIGIQICFDMVWDDGWAKLKEKGAEIVFWPSAYGGGNSINNKMWNHHYIVVSSTRKGAAKICDIDGNEPAGTGFWDPNFLCGPVNLNKEFLHCWPYVRCFDEIKQKYGRDVRITLFHDEEWSIIESLSPDIPIKQIMKEFQLKSYQEHKMSAEIAQIATRKNN